MPSFHPRALFPVFTCERRSLKPTELLLRVIIAAVWIWLTDWLTGWVNAINHCELLTPACGQTKEGHNPSVPPCRRHSTCLHCNQQTVSQESTAFAALPIKLSALRETPHPHPHPAPTPRQTNLLHSLSINKDAVFARLCEGVWLVAIMALAPARVIALTLPRFLVILACSSAPTDEAFEMVRRTCDSPSAENVAPSQPHGGKREAGGLLIGSASVTTLRWQNVAQTSWRWIHLRRWRPSMKTLLRRVDQWAFSVNLAESELRWVPCIWCSFLCVPHCCAMLRKKTLFLNK